MTTLAITGTFTTAQAGEGSQKPSDLTANFLTLVRPPEVDGPPNYFIGDYLNPSPGPGSAA